MSAVSVWLVGKEVRGLLQDPTMQFKGDSVLNLSKPDLMPSVCGLC